MMPAVPRLLNRLYDKAQSEISGSRIKKLLFNMALSAKESELKRLVFFCEKEDFLYRIKETDKCSQTNNEAKSNIYLARESINETKRNQRNYFLGKALNFVSVSELPSSIQGLSAVPHASR